MATEGVALVGWMNFKQVVVGRNAVDVSSAKNHVRIESINVSLYIVFEIWFTIGNNRIRNQNFSDRV